MENTEDGFIAPAPRKSLYEYISNRIMELIYSGTWKESDRIPGEIELARMFEVSRNSVRESIKALELIGILRAKSGNGTFVAEGALPRVRQFLAQAQSLSMDTRSLVEVMEARLTIEPGLVLLVCEKSKPEALAKLEENLDRCQEAFKTHTYDFELGFSFHHQLFLLSENKILINMYEQLIPVLLTTLKEIFFKHVNPDVLVGELQQHRDILALIRQGKKEQASLAMDAHIRTSLERLKKFL